MQLNTFSVAARCPKTGMLGVAVSTAVPAVGAICPFVQAGVGAIATQSWVNPYLGIDGLKLLANGLNAQQVLDALLANDPGREDRQVGIVDKHGNTAAFTGSRCVSWAGNIQGDNFTVQGNMLVGAETIESMAKSMEATKDLALTERLMQALEAGQAAGGDKRGKQSAALKVYHQEEYPWLDLRVDEDRAPVAELRRIFEIAAKQYLTFVAGMPTRANPLGGLPAEVTDMLMTTPTKRPGGSGR